ncbi:MAG TPA: outer membrane beta-barrel protein, partial [Saprospiraceae bacterium]|nr:outer membrane beta-barrel protein [Saprospiraceae bacterium]
MKNILFFLFTFCISVSSFSQLQINPQIGFLSASLDNAEKAVFDTKARTGWLLGADVRFGSSLYVQPGMFLTSSKTLFTYRENGIITEQEVKRTGLKLKALLGYYILPTPILKLRAALGPTYDFQIDIDDINSNVFKSDQFKKGSFNFDIGAGVNFLFLSFDVGYSFGLSDVIDINS